MTVPVTAAPEENGPPALVPTRSDPVRKDRRWEDLERLRSSPMMDAVIDEVRGRQIRIGDRWQIRIGDRWLSDFAPCMPEVD